MTLKQKITKQLKISSQIMLGIRKGFVKKIGNWTMSATRITNDKWFQWDSGLQKYKPITKANL